MRLIVNKYRFEMIDARKRKRYRTRQFHIRKSINKIYIYKKKYENSMQWPCKGACRIEKRSSNPGERIYGSYDIAIIRRNLSSVYYEKKKNGFRPESRPTRVYNHDYVSSVLPHRGSRDTNLPCDLSRLSSDRRLPARSVVVFCAYA